MAGMSRDKCGAGAAAGVMATVSQLAPAGVKVVAAMAMVRNSVGSNCYVADEIITSRAGVRLGVGNTDAEGRMVRLVAFLYLIFKSTNLRPWWMCSVTPRRRH